MQRLRCLVGAVCRHNRPPEVGELNTLGSLKFLEIKTKKSLQEQCLYFSVHGPHLSWQFPTALIGGPIAD